MRERVERGNARFTRGTREHGGSERSEWRTRTSVHVVARGEAWFVGGLCTPDCCNPLGIRCSAKPYSFLLAVRYPTLLLCLSISARSPLPTALPRALTAAVLFRVHVDPLCGPSARPRKRLGPPSKNLEQKARISLFKLLE